MGEEKSLENPQIPKKKLSPLKDLKNPHFRGEIPIVETLPLSFNARIQLNKMVQIKLFITIKFYQILHWNKLW